MDILARLLKYIPIYLEELLTLIRGPKSFMASKNREHLDKNLRDALLFLGLTIVIVSLLIIAPVVENNAVILKSASFLILTALAVVLFSLVLHLSWRIVGGKASLKSFMIIYAYYSGATTLFIAIFIAVNRGIIKFFSPESYKILVNADLAKIFEIIAELQYDTWVIVGGYVFITGYVIVSVWNFIGWGAYRQLNNLSKWKSFSAFFLAGLFSIPILVALHFIGVALQL